MQGNRTAITEGFHQTGAEMFNWLLFLLGAASYVLFQVDAIVRAKNNTAESRLKILQDRWVAFALRGVAGSMLFWIFLGGVLPEILMAFNVETPGWLMALSAVINSQAGPPVSYFCGLGVDSVLGFIPFLKSHLPSVEVVESSEFIKTTTDPKTGSTETVVKTTEVTKSPAPDPPKI